MAKRKLPKLLKEPVYILLVNESDGRRYSLRVTAKAAQLAVMLALGVLVTFVAALHSLGVQYDGPLAQQSNFEDWEIRIREQRDALDRLRRDAYYDFEGVELSVKEVAAHVARVEAMGRRMFEETGIEAGDFNMDTSMIGGVGGLPPAEGEVPEIDTKVVLETLTSLEEMDNLLHTRQVQLQILKSLVFAAGGERHEDRVSGRPLADGWISSGYGKRIDPISKVPAFHFGIDFGSRYGVDIIATGVGVVTFVGRDRMYGNYVELSHGQGLKTLYAHAGSISVKAGDVVEKGQTIGKVGDTGRSTGPHVHYEVLIDGKRTNPWKYIQSS